MDIQTRLSFGVMYFWSLSLVVRVGVHHAVIENAIFLLIICALVITQAIIWLRGKLK